MKRFRGVRFVYALLIAALAFGAFAVPAAQAAQQSGSIVEVALAANAETGEFSILIAALQAANPDLLRKLSSEREFTVFAPTDAAFAALLEELGLTAEQLLSDKALVSRVLRYHIARGSLDSTEVIASERIRTLQGGSLFQSGGVLTDVNGRSSTIVTTDIQASNGVIHVIDRVVLPKLKQGTDTGDTIIDVAMAANAESGEFSILIAALEAANPSLVQRLSHKQEYTVFAPTDAAFLALLDELGVTAEQLLNDQALLTRVLRYHIVRGELDSSAVLGSERLRTLQGGWLSQSDGILTDEKGRTANIVTTDIQAGNGVIHVIDRVVLPELKQGSDNGETLLDVALAANAESGEFSILIAALEAANPNLLKRLDSKKEYTVFAPTDAAFAALLEELGVTAEQLLSNKALVTKVLRYHIVRGSLDSTEVLASESICTLQGGSLSQNGGILTDANGRAASIITVDIRASNGVIHVIDRVVLPSMKPSAGDDDNEN
jgi:transforming growth factor-beta-induced protein